MSHGPRVAAFSFIADIAYPYPSLVCSSIFLSRCNFRCPYCINRKLVVGEEQKCVDFPALMERLLLRGETTVVVSGGEPFLHPDVFVLFEALKRAGMAVAVATNGSFPDRIEKAANEGLINHVVMDIKSRLDVESYSKVTGRDLSKEEFGKILRSIEYLTKGPDNKPSHEFRTTVCSKFVSKEDVFSIVDYIGYDNVYILQPFTHHQTLDPELSNPEFAIAYEELEAWAKELSDRVFACLVREV